MRCDQKKAHHGAKAKVVCGSLYGGKQRGRPYPRTLKRSHIPFRQHLHSHRRATPAAAHSIDWITRAQLSRQMETGASSAYLEYSVRRVDLETTVMHTGLSSFKTSVAHLSFGFHVPGWNRSQSTKSNDRVLNRYFCRRQDRYSHPTTV